MWKIGNFIAKLISFLLQPLLMPLYSVALLLVYTNFYDIYAGQVMRFLIPVATFSFLLPCLFILILWRLKYIKQLDSIEQGERTFPYIVFFASGLSLFYFFYTAGVNYWFLGLIAVIPLIAFVAFIINLFWKISVHMLGIGGLIGGVLSVSFNVNNTNPWMLFGILFFLAGCLGVSRLYLKVSTPAQVYVGFILGVILAFATVFAGAFSIIIPFING